MFCILFFASDVAYTPLVLLLFFFKDPVDEKNVLSHVDLKFFPLTKL